MKQGRHICNTLKSVRKKIADANDIKYEPKECHHEGDCAGTCPACEAEVRYLENELNKRSSIGKKVAVVGIAMGMASLASCGVGRIIQPPLAGIPVVPTDPQPQHLQAADSTATPPDIDEIEPLMGETPIEICTDTLRPVRADERVLEGVVEIQPMFPGGNQALQEYLRTNLQRPDEDTTGRVIVTFTIEKDGSITNAKVLKSLSEACDREALRLVNAMPKWAPGKQLGETVSTKYTMPIDF